jgi:high-affinity iron transporter
MLSAAIVVFRETIEIAMIVGVVLIATRGLHGRMPCILGGALAGIAGAALIAVFAGSISNAAGGMGQELFNAGILFTAALVIGWTVVWMRTHARTLSAHIRQVSADVSDGKLPFYTISVIVGLALLREGAEIVLFTYGMIAAGQAVESILTGCAIGLALGTVMGLALYFGLMRIPARHMLNVTSWMLMFLVAGLVASGVGYLTSAGYFEAYSQTLWDSSWLLSDESILGITLHGLIGYTAQPSLAQGVAYLGALAVLLIALRLTRAPAEAPKTLATSNAQQA